MPKKSRLVVKFEGKSFPSGAYLFGAWLSPTWFKSVSVMADNKREAKTLACELLESIQSNTATQ